VRRFRAFPIVALRGDSHSPIGMATPLSRLSEDELRDHGPWLRRVARGLVASESDAEDLAQDVWLELARGAGPIAHLRALSARVARRLAGHRREAERARGRREAAAARPEALPGREELEGALEIQRLLLEELTALDELHRTPLLLHFYEGLSAAEIARRRGVPASTVRSQLARALAELRARMDRRHGGQRALWVALVARLPERGTASGTAVAGGAAAGGLLLTTLGKSLVAAGVLGALAVTWRFTQSGEEPTPSEVARADDSMEVRAPALVADSASALSEPETTAAARTEAIEAASTRSVPRDVPLLVLDEASGQPLADFELQVENGREDTLLTTDAWGRTVIAGPWFDAPFELTFVNDDASPYGYGTRELGPADRPEQGAELVLRCATGPIYTLHFDAPPPPLEGLVANLSKGTEQPVEPRFPAGLHRDGARIWTRFIPTDVRQVDLGDGPWTLTVFAEDGLWRAHGPVHAIVGEQREPVLLSSQVCAVLLVELECDVAPQEGDFHVSLYRIVEGESVEPRHERIEPQRRSLRLEHLFPGEYRLWTGSPVHETAGARVNLAAGASETVRFALAAKAGVAALRVVVTSQSGTLAIGPIGAEALEVGGTFRRHAARWSDESTATRRLLLFEGLQLAEHEVTLSGLGPFGGMGVAPGRSVRAHPGGEDLVFTLLDSSAPPMVSGRVRALARAGDAVEDTSVTTYYDGTRCYQHGAVAPKAVQLERIAEGTRFDLLVGSEGFQPRYLRDLTLPFDVDPLEVRLDPGWGTWLDVVLAPGSGSNPTPYPVGAAGASVRLDGVLAGILDERGQLLLLGDARPAKIEIDYPGYHVAYGNIDPVSGAPTMGTDAQWVVLEPDPAAERR
jgi:RNA polymerase sigma factor (sigma-70 family)